ncbi:hypothetical protein KSC_106040 [Ktedonobacter sp. SOSP1-52]|nr:hypothetical protein KSC_106040 [Ktedonobacter sp. SOSP1-52]
MLVVALTTAPIPHLLTIIHLDDVSSSTAAVYFQQLQQKEEDAAYTMSHLDQRAPGPFLARVV